MTSEEVFNDFNSFEEFATVHRENGKYFVLIKTSTVEDLKACLNRILVKTDQLFGE